MQHSTDTSNNRQEKVGNLIKELVAQFLNRENNHTSLLSVTSVSISPDLKRATVYITVLPADKEQNALEFTKRKRGQMREFLKQNLEMKTIPFLEVAIDLGEKNRQRIDELLRQK
ncbi:MAG: 30S ribosome-binding factor RbfA [bacterium]|nr:30S ribosome-binding factor RbfA [bacterium]